MNEKTDIKFRILETAKELFARYGYAKVKTSEVANLLGISKRTLYENFSSKEDLYSAVVDEVIEINNEKIQKLLDRIDGDNDENFYEWLRLLWDVHLETVAVFTKEFLTDIEKVSPYNWKKIQNFRSNQFKTNFEKIYDFGISKGYLKSKFCKEVVYMTYTSVFNHMLKPEVMATLPLTLKEIMQNVSEILFSGTLTDKGREQFLCRLELTNNNIQIG
jgi:hypothetical protein